MIDRTTGNPIRVEPGSLGPRIRLPYEQLGELRGLLDARHIGYSVRENIISLSGGPFLVVVNFDDSTNEDTLQAILDSVR